MKMPWGKYRGQDLEDVPDSYVRWLAENCEDAAIRDEAENEIKYRKDHNASIED